MLSLVRVCTCVCLSVYTRCCCLCVGIREEIREVEKGVYNKDSNVLKVGEGRVLLTQLYGMQTSSEYTLYS